MTSFNRTASFVAALLAGAAAVTVPAAEIFTSRALWQDATPGFTNLDFGGYPGNGSYVGDFTASGILFDAKATYGPDEYMYSYGPSIFDIGSGNYMLGGFSVINSYRRFLDVTVPDEYNSFGLDVATYGISGFISVTAATSFGIYEQRVATPYGARSFVGFALESTETLSYLRVENVNSIGGVDDENYMFDNFSFGTQSRSSVPDGGGVFSCLGLALAGLAGLHARARRTSIGTAVLVRR